MDIRLLPARIADLRLQCQKTSAPKFLGFLTPSESAVAAEILKNTSGHTFFGGYPLAERTVLAFLPDWCEQPTFPIRAITFTYRKCDSLSHRDFLGALMALGINRETIGDILVEQGRAVVFVLDDIEAFVLSQVTKVGSVGVTLQKGYVEPLPTSDSLLTLSNTVSSLRIDCVVSALCGLSRSNAASAICNGTVSVNSIETTKTTSTVKSGDVITVRQRGKFKITSCDEHSKKGKIILKYSKYI